MPSILRVSLSRWTSILTLLGRSLIHAGRVVSISLSASSALAVVEEEAALAAAAPPDWLRRAGKLLKTVSLNLPPPIIFRR